MITVYRLFQIIMGLMLSGFIFFILISFARDYASLGREGVRYKTVDVFLQDVDNVYFSGNPIVFTEFTKEYSSCHPTSTNPPRIHCYIEESSMESESLLVPVFMRAGEETLITRNRLDLGWTYLDYVEALVPVTIVFNPLDDDDDTWNLMGDIARALPDTTGQDVKVGFDFCDAGSLLIEENLGTSYERGVFLDMIDGIRDSVAKCTRALTEKQILVTISPSCSSSFTGSGVCVRPSSMGAGRAYIAGHTHEYVYKDPVDLAALIIGGEKENVFGEPAGRETWRFKNIFMLDSIRTAAMIKEKQCDLLMSLDSTPEECRSNYLELKGSLSDIQTLAQGDFNDYEDMAALSEELENARSLWNGLLEIGCESNA
ncbi:MAG: hypothetical protein KAT35_02505 [Candidatus Aenigmarchaeota archaeon]|nr:hypothetical protein [Candidatus Aenigmarchaeota archaeon]